MAVKPCIKLNGPCTLNFLASCLEEKVTKRTLIVTMCTEEYEDNRKNPNPPTATSKHSHKGSEA